MAAGIHVLTNTTITRANREHVEEIVPFLKQLGTSSFAVNSVIRAGRSRDVDRGLSEEELLPVLSPIVLFVVILFIQPDKANAFAALGADGRTHPAAKVVQAEAEVPKAMAEAFRTAKLSVMDYFKLRNVQADTEMRKSIATSPFSGERSVFADISWVGVLAARPTAEQERVFAAVVSAREAAAAAIEAGLAARRAWPVARPFNIDPGLMTDARVVLATTKDRGHRIYRGDGGSIVFRPFRPAIAYPFAILSPRFKPRSLLADEFCRSLKERILGLIREATARRLPGGS